MRNQVDYVICPKCNAMFAAMWYTVTDRKYKIKCTECKHLYEAGDYDHYDILLFFDEESQQEKLALSPDEINQVIGREGIPHREDDYGD